MRAAGAIRRLSSIYYHSLGRVEEEGGRLLALLWYGAAHLVVVEDRMIVVTVRMASLRLLVAMAWR